MLPTVFRIRSGPRPGRGLAWCRKHHRADCDRMMSYVNGLLRWIIAMDSVDHPLDWWANGGYPAVMRELKCTKAVARHKVHQKILEYFKRTGDPIWKPVGNRGYAQLRQAIMDGCVLDNDLV